MLSGSLVLGLPSIRHQYIPRMLSNGEHRRVLQLALGRNGEEALGISIWLLFTRCVSSVPR